MRCTLPFMLFAFALAPAVVQAQAAAPEPASPYARAPWWMGQPIIASTGHVRTEIATNRGSFSAVFHTLGKDAPAATRAAADKVRALGQALREFGADKVRVETTFDTRPLYEQYKDKDGNLQENQRPDKIERYAVTADVQVEVRDISLIERAYAAVLAAGPSSVSEVEFELKPENETKTALFRAAVEDAARRARLAAEATGSRLGPVKLIDPTGRACETDVLVAGAPRPEPQGPDAENGLAVQEVVVTGARRAAIAPAPPPPRVAPAQLDPAAVEAMKLPLQPPNRELTATACVVYGLL
jgi:uncharacterized protein YggE